MSSLVTKDCAIISPLQFSADVIWPGKKAEVLSKAGHTWRVIRRSQPHPITYQFVLSGGDKRSVQISSHVHYQI